MASRVRSSSTQTYDARRALGRRCLSVWLDADTALALRRLISWREQSISEIVAELIRMAAARGRAANGTREK